MSGFARKHKHMSFDDVIIKTKQSEVKDRFKPRVSNKNTKQ